MVKKNTSSILILLVFSILICSCSIFTKEKTLKTKSKDRQTENQVEKQIFNDDFKAVPYHELLANSEHIQYPVNGIFTPKYLTDHNLIIGELISSDNDIYLLFLSPNSEKWEIIREQKRQSNFEHFVVHSAKGDYLFYQISDQVTQINLYYLYNFKTKENILIHKVEMVPAINVTEVSWGKDILVFNCFSNEAEQYKTYIYDINKKEKKLLLITIMPHQF